MHGRVVALRGWLLAPGLITHIGLDLPHAYFYGQLGLENNASGSVCHDKDGTSGLLCVERDRHRFSF